MDTFKQTLAKAGFKGEMDDTPVTRDFYSHDASLFEIKPQIVMFPTDSADVQKLVKAVAANKKDMPQLSITGRSAGTCMSGGAVNDSIIIDFTRHLNKVGAVSSTEASAQPGVYYRDFEPETLKYEALMPSYPASRDLAALGGMVNNNAGGEKSLEFGKTRDFVNSLQVVFADGKEYTVRPLNKKELDAKMAQGDYEGNI